MVPPVGSLNKSVNLIASSQVQRHLAAGTRVREGRRERERRFARLVGIEFPRLAGDVAVLGTRFRGAEATGARWSREPGTQAQRRTGILRRRRHPGMDVGRRTSSKLIGILQ